ncbi:hypothetical protein AAC387_Pa03g4054 [Persea americana]
MSPPQEHDYIGLSEVSSMEGSDKISSASSTLSAEDDVKSNALNLKETELRLGLPGSESPERKEKSGWVLKSLVSGAKRGFSDAIDGSGKWGNGGQQLGPSPGVKDGGSTPKPAQEKKAQVSAANEHGAAPASKAQVVGWPPIRSFRKNTMATNPVKNSDDAEGKLGMGCLYVKVSMDGAPYLRKVDLKTYSNYVELSSALEKMFSCFTIGQCGSHGVPGREGLTESRLMDLLHGSEYVLTYEDKDGDWMLVGDVPWEMFTDSCRRLRIMKGSEAIGLAPRAMEKCKNRN